VDLQVRWKLLRVTSFTLTSTLTQYSYTFTTNTLVGKTFGTNNDDRITAVFTLMWGATFGASRGIGSAETFVGAGDTYITQVELNPGASPLTYVPKTYAQDLLECQRYLYDATGGSTSPNISIAPAFPDSTTTSRAFVPFPVTMRTTPTMVANTAANFSLGVSFFVCCERSCNHHCRPSWRASQYDSGSSDGYASISTLPSRNYREAYV